MLKAETQQIQKLDVDWKEEEGEVYLVWEKFGGVEKLSERAREYLRMAPMNKISGGKRDE